MEKELNLSPYTKLIRSSDIQRLKLCDNTLLKEQKWLEESLKVLNTQLISLAVEKLHLQRLLDEEKKIFKEPANEQDKEIIEELPEQDVNQLDEVGSSLNNKQLDLSVLNDLDNILQGKFYTKGYSPEEEESEEE